MLLKKLQQNIYSNENLNIMFTVNPIWNMDLWHCAICIMQYEKLYVVDVKLSDCLAKNIFIMLFIIDNSLFIKCLNDF